MRPDFVTDEMLEYLDDLRESGETNMFGAAKYLDQAFPELQELDDSGYTSSKQARATLVYWMETFGQEDR